MELLKTIAEIAEFVEVTSEVSECRDPKYNFLLSLAIDVNADYLLTGDNDLLVLEKIGDSEIKTISEFLDELDT